MQVELYFTIVLSSSHLLLFSVINVSQGTIALKNFFFIKYCLQPKEPGVSPFSVMADNCIDQVLQPISRIASNIFMCTVFFNLCGICLSFVKCSFVPNLEIVSFLYIYSYNLISKIFSQLNPIFVWFC